MSAQACPAHVFASATHVAGGDSGPDALIQKKKKKEKKKRKKEKSAII